MKKSLIDKLITEKWVGWYGEILTTMDLKLTDVFGRRGKILRNLYVPKDNDETSEIDVIYITKKGIFVVESKNYSGWIFGDETSLKWTVCLPNKQKNKFYNPVKQNASHIKHLSQYLEDEIPMFSLIVFSERCTLKKISVHIPDVHVLKRDLLYATVREIWSEKKDVLDEETQKKIYEKLKKLTKVSAEQKRQHIESIRKKFES